MKIMYAVMVVLVALITGTGCSNQPVADKSTVTPTTQEKFAALGDLRADGLKNLLDGWTFVNHWSEDDWRVDTILESYGAKPVESGSVPDVGLESTHNNAQDEILWVSYRGQNRYVRKGDPEFHTEVTKIIVDMARLRLAEFRDTIAKKQGHK